MLIVSFDLMFSHFYTTITKITDFLEDNSNHIYNSSDGEGNKTQLIHIYSV